MTTHAAYRELANQHRANAARLLATAEHMAGYRGLPMGRHDPRAMADARAVETFEKFVRLEHELFTLLQNRLEQDRKMLAEMGGAGRA